MRKGEGGAPNANNAPGHVKAYDKRVAAAMKMSKPKLKGPTKPLAPKDKKVK